MGEKKFLLLEPFESAWAHMRRTLFQPFLWQKWFAWGLLAFIGANIQHGGGFPNIFSYIMDEQEHRSDHFTGSGFPAEALPGDLSSWFGGNAWVIAAVIGGIALVFLAVIILLTYIFSRGRFMFVECLVENKTAIGESWRRNGTPALSLFWWYIGFSVFILLLLLLAGVTVFLTLFRDGEFAPFGEIWPQLLAVGFGTLLAILPIAAIAIYLEDFVVPLMWSRRIRVLEAWNAFFNIFQEHTGALLLYLLMRLGLSIAAGFVMSCGVCLTCCVAALPVIGQTLLLPIYVVMRMYPIQALARVEPSLAERLAAFAPPVPAVPVELPPAPAVGPEPDASPDDAVRQPDADFPVSPDTPPDPPRE